MGGSWMKNTLPERCGTTKLLGGLSQVIANMVRIQVPDVLVLLSTLIEKTQKEIRNRASEVTHENVKEKIASTISILCRKVRNRVDCECDESRELPKVVRCDGHVHSTSTRGWSKV